MKNSNFLNNAENEHGDKYDYSLVVYVNSQTKVKIICPKHGIFEQSPNSHLGGSGCPACSGRRLNTQIFIKKANKVHGIGTFDYSLVDYKGTAIKVKIICPLHGEFEQTPNSHLSGSGCIECSNIKRNISQKLGISKFIKRAKGVHGDKYDYSKVEYVNSHTKVKIICKKHGEFEQIPSNQLKGSGCPKCGVRNKLTTIEFIKKAKEVHGDKYDYSLVDYKGAVIKVKIICKVHGEFEQTANIHLAGRGCSKCALLN